VSIDIGIDDEGHSLRLLVFNGLQAYPTQSLFQFLHDRNSIVRTAAARRLQTQPEVELVFAHVRSLAGFPNAYAREISAFVLGQLGTPRKPFKSESVPILVRLCGDRAHEVRIAALAALWHLQGTAAEPFTQFAEGDRDARVRAAASQLRKLIEEASE
jgi:HEAT repeat protein